MLVKRVLQQKKAYQQHFQQKFLQHQIISQQGNDSQQKKPEVEDQQTKKIEEHKLKPVHCTTPKFSNITHNTAYVSWKVSDTKKDQGDLEAVIIYELQRVDKQPSIIIFSGK